jgi:hypothetical protein
VEFRREYRQLEAIGGRPNNTVPATHDMRDYLEEKEEEARVAVAGINLRSFFEACIAKNGSK